MPTPALPRAAPACPATLPSLPTRLLQDALAFIVRVYAVLLTAQAPLLYGIRQVRGRARVWAANLTLPLGS